MSTVTEKNESKECIDLHVSIPCELANRVRGYAEKNDTDVANILIEAIDAFLRNRKTSDQ